MQEYVDYTREAEDKKQEEHRQEDRMNLENTNNKINKVRRRFGILSLVTGIAVIAITLATSGIVVIPLVIGSYLVVNGLINMKKLN